MHPKQWRIWCAALAAAAVIAGSALAQAPFGLFGGRMFLLRRPDVQMELKVTDDQKKQLMEAGEKFRASGQELREKLQNASMEERMKLLAERTAEETRVLGGILNKDQQTRLRQLVLQQQGLTAAAQPDVADELKLTDDQKTKVREIVAGHLRSVRELFQGGANADAREKFLALTRETSGKVEAILTGEQKTRWKEMQGAEFKFQQQ